MERIKRIKNAQDLPVAIYIRVSTKDDQELSVEAQYEMITRYCKSKNLKYSDDYIFIDRISGKRNFFNRTSGSKIKNLIMDGKIGAIVALRIERLSRNTLDLLNVIEFLRRSNVALHFLDFLGESVNTEDPMNYFSITMYVAISEYDRKMIGRRVTEIMSNKRRDNRVVSKHAPYGYKKSEAGYIIPDAKEQIAIQKMIYYRDELHLSYNEIATKLYIEDKILNRNKHPFDRIKIYKILNEINSKYYSTRAVGKKVTDNESEHISK